MISSGFEFKRDGWFRSWIKGIILEAISLHKINYSVEIIANRPPTERDSNYSVGAVWYKEKESWVLTKVEAKWEKEGMSKRWK